jgi:hypothetical protein
LLSTAVAEPRQECSQTKGNRPTQSSAASNSLHSPDGFWPTWRALGETRVTLPAAYSLLMVVESFGSYHDL